MKMEFEFYANIANVLPFKPCKTVSTFSTQTDRACKALVEKCREVEMTDAIQQMHEVTSWCEV